KTLGLYANVRPCVAYHPFVQTLHPGMDVVIVRENEEDLYAGIEHRQTENVVQCLKLISRPGCEKIARYAFEYARRHSRRKVTCFTKDNIMKLTDGRLHNAWLKTIEDGIHTYDVYTEGTSAAKVGTREFAQAVVERLGEKPGKLKPAVYSSAPSAPLETGLRERNASERTLVGMDVFVNW